MKNSADLVYNEVCCNTKVDIPDDLGFRSLVVQKRFQPKSAISIVERLKNKPTLITSSFWSEKCGCSSKRLLRFHHQLLHSQLCRAPKDSSLW